jgi:hypothetical protein
VQDIVRAITWSGTTIPDFASPIEAVKYLQTEHNLTLGSCDLDYDEVRGRKTGIVRSTSFNPHAAGIYIVCKNILAIDLDGLSHQSHTLLNTLRGRCNMVALTRKGAHLLFKAHHRWNTNRANTTYQIDIRTGEGGILMVEPSYYHTPTGTQRYKWFRIPMYGSTLLEFPDDCSALLERWMGDGAGPGEKRRRKR